MRLLLAAVVLSFTVVTSTGPVARADTCSSNESSCGDGTCCAPSSVCCPAASDGCCNVATPYCCGEGTCAVSASACPGAAGDAGARCAAYDVPCGDGCIAAGSDCCDGLGHYCAAGRLCASEATCTDGTRTQQAKTYETGEPSPLSNPMEAASRSCAMSRSPSSSRATLGYALAAAVLVVARRARRSAR